MKNLIQWILLLGGLYFLWKKFNAENQSKKINPKGAIQKKSQTVLND